MMDMLPVAIWLVGYPMGLGVYRIGAQKCFPDFYRDTDASFSLVVLGEYVIWILVALWLAP